MRSVSPVAIALAALALFAVAVAGFGAWSPDFGHLRHPVALLGAIGEPNALAFNLLGFVAPGLALAWLAWRWRGQQAAGGWRARIGLQLLLLSALAFVAQGLLPLDPTDLLAPASRAHAVAWSAWWLAFVAGAVLVALVLASAPVRRATGWLVQPRGTWWVRGVTSGSAHAPAPAVGRPAEALAGTGGPASPG